VTAPAAVGPTTDTRSSWLVLAVVMVGSCAALLNTTVMGVALPALAEDFGDDGAAVDWVVTSFLIGVVAVQPVAGWLTDRLGRKAVYVASLVGFGAGAAVCATAQSMEVLIGGRLLQGFGGGVLMPVGMAMVYAAFPAHRRGTALGFWALGWSIAPLVGPPFGGWLVAVASWRWIYVLFVIVALASAVLAAWFLVDDGARLDHRLDVLGWALAAAAVVLTVVVAREAASWGLVPFPTVTLAAAAAALFVGFVRHTRDRPDPIVEVRLFASRAYATAAAVVLFLSLAQAARTTIVPVALQIGLGLDVQQVGALLVADAVGVTLTLSVGGWLADRIGARRPVVGGLFLVAASMWMLAHLPADPSVTWLGGVLFVQGLGSGLAFIPTTVAAMRMLPDRFVAQGSAVLTLTRHVTGSVAMAVLASLLVADLGAVASQSLRGADAMGGYRHVFLIAFWWLIGGVAAATCLPGRASVRRPDGAGDFSPHALDGPGGSRQTHSCSGDQVV
jgi:EmrB/QacA subfamily drug resistance transporter